MLKFDTYRFGLSTPEYFPLRIRYLIYSSRALLKFTLISSSWREDVRFVRKWSSSNFLP